MNILINASNLHKGGGVQIGDAFIRGLCRHPEHDYLVICTRELSSSLGDLNSFPKFVHFETIDSSRTVFQLCRKNAWMDRWIRRFSADMVFTVFGPPYWRPPVPHVCGYAKAQFIYLDSPFFGLIGKTGRLKQRIKRFVQLMSFRHDADAFVTETQDISERLRKIVRGKSVYTVSNCCNPVFDRREEWIYHELPPFDGVTLLTVSANYPHKNLGIIPRAAEYLRGKYPDFKFRFVVTLAPEDFGCTDSNLPDWLLPIGKVNIRECPSLYEQCDMMFLPTLLECFSASYVEAMKMRRPILTSDLPFARGLCGMAAEYFDPMSPAAVGEAIHHLAGDRKRRDELVDAGEVQIGNFLDADARTSNYLHVIECEFAKKCKR